jgi:hypothetical protein
MSLRRALAIVGAVVVLPLLGAVWALNRNGETHAKDQSRALYISQLAACGRGNVLRAESNQRAYQHRKQVEVDNIILTFASRARLAAYRRDRHTEDLEAYQGYQRGLRINATIVFKIVPLVRCLTTVQPPKGIDRLSRMPPSS